MPPVHAIRVHSRKAQHRYVGHDDEREEAPSPWVRGICGKYVQLFMEGVSQEAIKCGFVAADSSTHAPIYDR